MLPTIATRNFGGLQFPSRDARQWPASSPPSSQIAKEPSSGVSNGARATSGFDDA